MAYSNKGTPLLKTKADDETSEEQAGLPNFENFRCEFHPHFKIDALYVNTSTGSINILCIKCIIDGDCFKQSDDYKLVTIKELLQTCSDTIIKQKKDLLKSRDGLQDRFVGFLTKDYVSTYEKYLEAQYQAIDQDINQMIEKLNLVREKYKDYYTKELDTVKEQGSDVKGKINNFIEGNMEIEKQNFTSLEEIYEHLNKITTNDELSTFLRELYQESRERFEDVTSTDEVRRVLSNMENIKEKAECTKDKGITEVPSFKDIKQTLDNLLQNDSKIFKRSIDIANKSTKFDFEPITNFKALDANNIFLSPPENDERDMSAYTSSPAMKDIHSTARKQQRDMNNQETVKKRRKNFKETDINSQSLKKLKKICENTEQDGSATKKEKLISSLNDWINRRITGYLIFQNSMNSAGSKRPGISDTGVHLNHATGSKWKTMSEKEKEEYKNLAKEYRKIFKREVEECENLENTNDIIEEFDEKIKKIKLF